MKQILIFQSILKQEMEDFLVLRKSQGHVAEKEKHIYITLDRYLLDTQYYSKNLVPDIVEGWLSSLPEEMNINTKIVYISHYAQFAKYLTNLGYKTFIPERPVEDRHYTPYIFTEDELQALVKGADNTFASINTNGKHSAACFTIILRMLIGCGFRLNEVLSLKTMDVDFVNAVVYVKSAKGNKDRIVPMHNSMVEILKCYFNSGIPKKDGLFFPSKNGSAFSQTASRFYFNKYLTHAGIQKPDLGKYERNICIHCLRHTFAVAAFRKLDLSGKDMYDEAPILSTYMGHDRIYGTEKYLHMTAENSADILDCMEKFNEGLFPEVDE